MFDGRIKFLNRAKRFAKPPPQPGRSLSQRVEHFFFLRRLYLLARNGVAILAVDRVQIDYVMAARRINIANQHGFDAPALAHLSRDWTGQAFFWWSCHEPRGCRNLR